MIIYGLLCVMAPKHGQDPDDPTLLRMHGPTFPKRSEAEDEQHMLRRQNLPFRTFIVEIEDPRP